MKNITKNLLLASLFITVSLAAFAQKITKEEHPEYGTPDYLLIQKGFSIFKLGDHIDNYGRYVTRNIFYDTDRTNQVYKLTDPNLLVLENDIKIKDIELIVNRGLIQSIVVFIDKEYKDDFLTTLKTHYGDGEGTESTLWKSKDTKIVLSYAHSYKSTDIARAMFIHNALDEVRDANQYALE